MPVDARIWDHPLSTYAKSFEKLTFLSSGGWLEMLVFRKILRTNLMDGPMN